MSTIRTCVHVHVFVTGPSNPVLSLMKIKASLYPEK